MSFRRTDHQQTNAGGRTCHDWSTALKETASPKALATRPTIRNRAPTWSVWRGLRLQTRETNPYCETPRSGAGIVGCDSLNKGLCLTRQNRLLAALVLCLLACVLGLAIEQRFRVARIERDLIDLEHDQLDVRGVAADASTAAVNAQTAAERAAAAHTPYGY